MDKVYVVEYGQYSNQRIEVVFATRDLAERYVVERERRGWGADTPDSTVLRDDDPAFPEMTAGFDAWVEEFERLTYEVVRVTEFDVWDAIPIADVA